MDSNPSGTMSQNKPFLPEIASCQGILSQQQIDATVDSTFDAENRWLGWLILMAHDSGWPPHMLSHRKAGWKGLKSEQVWDALPGGSSMQHLSKCNALVCAYSREKWRRPQKLKTTKGMRCLQQEARLPQSYPRNHCHVPWKHNPLSHAHDSHS